jgi:hypothetical protein
MRTERAPSALHRTAFGSIVPIKLARPAKRLEI